MTTTKGPMTINVILKAAWIGGLLMSASSIQAQTAAITTFDCPAAGNTYASGINALGQVTGWCSDGLGTHAFVKNGATVTMFDGATPTYVTNGNGINATGQVTGYYLDGLGANKGFVYSNGAVSLFSILNVNNLPTGYMIPRSINASGKVTGEYLEYISPTQGVYRGFIYDSATKTSTTFDAVGTLGYFNSTVPVAINDNGQLTGSSGAQGFVYSGGVGTLFAATNASQTVPRNINVKGDVVGTFYDLNNAQHGFIYSAGTVTTYDIPGATTTDIWTINDSGQIGGYYIDTLNVIHGFVKTGTVVTTVDAPVSNETAVRSINASGQAAGYYADALGLLHGFVTGAIGGTGGNPPPPPSTLSCIAPKGAKSSAGTARVTATGAGFIMVGTLRIDFAACTEMNYGGNAKAPKVSDAVEWEGYVQANGSVMAKTLSFN
jgi:hypothetical protein